jgi:hypothetical protein
VVIGIAALSRRVYSSRAAGICFLVLSVIAPGILIFVATGAPQKWIAVLCLATTLVNIAVVAGALQQGRIPVLQLPQKIQKRAKSLGVNRQVAPHPVQDRTAEQNTPARIAAIASPEPPFKGHDVG